MSTRTKTRAVAVYPDGHRFVITRRNGVYWYSSTAGASHMDMVHDAVERAGGQVVREPNPSYRPSRPGRLTYADEAFARLFA